ncbi:MAG TPA: hypothetical protein PKD64_08580 [Pirellulaceae bacterium]|nr:hypothetical protein [Pirellulaceae bacterium]HMO92242.1 hypothetical protein [Pirellulaceae bacterium]HMP70751.1 hypothetical protein [Pirellulaceae bacterium]
MAILLSLAIGGTTGFLLQNVIEPNSDESQIANVVQGWPVTVLMLIGLAILIVFSVGQALAWPKWNDALLLVAIVIHSLLLALFLSWHPEGELYSIVLVIMAVAATILYLVRYRDVAYRHALSDPQMFALATTLFSAALALAFSFGSVINSISRTQTDPITIPVFSYVPFSIAIALLFAIVATGLLMIFRGWHQEVVNKIERVSIDRNRSQERLFTDAMRDAKTIRAYLTGNHASQFVDKTKYFYTLAQGLGCSIILNTDAITLQTAFGEDLEPLLARFQEDGIDIQMVDAAPALEAILFQDPTGTPYHAVLLLNHATDLDKGMWVSIVDKTEVQFLYQLYTQAMDKRAIAPLKSSMPFWLANRAMRNTRSMACTRERLRSNLVVTDSVFLTRSYLRELATWEWKTPSSPNSVKPIVLGIDQTPLDRWLEGGPLSRYLESCRDRVSRIFIIDELDSLAIHFSENSTKSVDMNKGKAKPQKLSTQKVLCDVLKAHLGGVRIDDLENYNVGVIFKSLGDQTRLPLDVDTAVFIWDQNLSEPKQLLAKGLDESLLAKPMDGLKTSLSVVYRDNAIGAEMGDGDSGLFSCKRDDAARVVDEFRELWDTEFQIALDGQTASYHNCRSIAKWILNYKCDQAGEPGSSGGGEVNSTSILDEKGGTPATDSLVQSSDKSMHVDAAAAGAGKADEEIEPLTSKGSISKNGEEKENSPKNKSDG